MKTVQEIKAKYAKREEMEETALLRAIAPAVHRRREERMRQRQREKAGKARVNAALERRGIPLRIV